MKGKPDYYCRNHKAPVPTVRTLVTEKDGVKKYVWHCPKCFITVREA